MTYQEANIFACHWIAAWNSHDLERILSHYTDDFTLSSPIIEEVLQEPTGSLTGKNAIRHFWSEALEAYPDLHFEKLQVLCGATSVTILFNGVKGLSAEVFHFDAEGKVFAAHAHYQQLV